MSADKQLNPFEGNRWESDLQHIIYLPGSLFADLEKRQDIYLVGSRGTGKTTFLKALNWETRLENNSIKMQIEEGKLFEKKYIGIYIDTMSFGGTIFDRNKDYTNDVSLMLLYSLWAEINVLYRVIESIEGLYGKGYIDFTIEAEQQQCNKIYDYLSNLFGDTILNKRMDTKTEYNITLLKEVVDELREKTIVEHAELKRRCYSYSYGNLIETTVPELVGLCDGDNTNLCDEDNTNKWCTKICFDQIESAPNFHKIVNTLVVRKLSDRIWFIVSGLNRRDIDMNQTYVPNHNLTTDDVINIDLDNEFFFSDKTKLKAFNSLAEGICDLRLKRADNKIDDNTKFDLSKHLGKWAMNQILDTLLMKKQNLSVNKKFETFMELVKENQEKSKYRTKFPPYIETYYYDILDSAKKWEGVLRKSREKNSDTGKKYIVITLALLKEYNLKASTPYVGHRQIMSLCSSTRDFLKIMEALFNVRMKTTSIKNSNDFFSFEAELTLKEINTQTEAVENVAKDKYDGIKTKYGSGKAIARMNYFIDICGNILYDLQAKQELSSLMSVEKRIFTVSFKDDKKGNCLRKFLLAASADTYIKILNEDTRTEKITVDFELSRLFAPKYKYYFRLTQNKIILDGEILKELFTCPDDSCEEVSNRLINTVENRYKFTDKRKQITDKSTPNTQQKSTPNTQQKSTPNTQQKTLF